MSKQEEISSYDLGFRCNGSPRWNRLKRLSEEQDNPFATGVTVNEDIVVESHQDEAGIHISVDLSGARNRLQNELDNHRQGLALTNPEE